MLLGEEAPCQPFDDIPSATLRKASAARNDMSDEQKAVLNKLEHERTCRFYLLHNYSYAEKTNDNTRENNLLKPFDKLNDFEKQMVEISWTLIDELASHKAAKGR